MNTKKKIAVLTLHWSNNYGAVYQAYALQTFLRDNGYEPVILDYRMESVPLSRILRRPLKSLQKSIQKNLLNIKNIGLWLAKKRMSSTDSQEAKPLFDSFRRKWLNISSEQYSYEDLKKLQHDFSAYIVGSDQVWAADFEFTSDAYVLGFIDRDSYRGKLLSYAPSFGKSSLEPYLRAKFRNALRKFDAISCREASGCEIVKSVVGREAKRVVDPTLLIDDYSEIISNHMVPERPFLLVYALSQEAKLESWFAETVRYVARNLGLEVLVVAPDGCDSALSPNIVKPTPEELLGLIEKCDFFLTNSFHGTVFGIALEAEFLVLARDQYDNKQNVRMKDLLETAKLGDRYIGPFQDLAQRLDVVKNPVDFTVAKRNLGPAVTESQKYLLESLLMGGLC